MTPEVAQHDQFCFHVYRERGQRHHQPHCHIRRSDGSAETVVALISLKVIVGPQPSRKERKALREDRAALIAAWKERNE